MYGDVDCFGPRETCTHEVSVALLQTLGQPTSQHHQHTTRGAALIDLPNIRTESGGTMLCFGAVKKCNVLGTRVNLNRTTIKNKPNLNLNRIHLPTELSTLVLILSDSLSIAMPAAEQSAGKNSSSLFHLMTFCPLSYCSDITSLYPLSILPDTISFTIVSCRTISAKEFFSNFPSLP